MSLEIPVRRRSRMWGRIAVALACAGVLTSGLPGGLQHDADAAPKPPQRCDQKYKIPKRPPPPGQSPEELPYDVRPETDWDEYDFDNDRKAMDGLTLPTDPKEREEFQKRIGTDYKKYPEGDPRRVFSTFFNNQENGKQKWTGTFEEWLNEQYIENQARNQRGLKYEAKVVKDLQLGGPDWLCQYTVEIPDPDDPKKTIKRTYDAYNKRTKEFLEFKSGGEHDGGQTPKDRKILNHQDFKEHKLRYVFGQEQKKNTRTALGNLNRAVGGTDAGRRVSTYEHRSTAAPRWRQSVYSKYDTWMNATPKPNQGSTGGGNDVVNRSAPNPEDARKQMERARQLNRGGTGVRGPGGVDFSTLELRYVGKPVKGKGLDYSFSARKTDEDTNPGWGGKEKAQLVSDSFLTWLALTPEKFWVNLNPDQPDKIMDSAFGRTDAGRILLEADLRMKHDFYEAMDPKTDLGKRFWESLPKQNGMPCLHGIRNWIEPKPAQVREQDGGIYILDAPLKLNSTPQQTDTGGPGEPICNPSDAEARAAQVVVDRMIVPEVEKEINTAPQYADLRRVYTSRVAAEWIRQQDAKNPTDYHKIINSDDVSKWPIRGAKWDKNDVYRKYVKIFKEGEFRYEIPARGTVYTYIVGGVDLSKAPKRNITSQRFVAEHRHLPRTKDTSVKAMTDDAESKDTLYLGGNTSGKSTGGDPTPDPTPSDPEPTDSTTPSHSPDPGNSPSPGGEPSKPVDPKDPDGDLAHTGSDTPIGLIAGIAAALAAAGAALVWWKRRRDAAQT
ncbi:LPXTG cell wall anchor domain-containing protein [Streptomyces sp. NPDC001820]|uniref:LPXTG cell wall anchor domain-containing protein n=1 Tax=Streptomyces sp. NPDC001820 TaxID=3364613 RepID=UPI0036B018EB